MRIVPLSFFSPPLPRISTCPSLRITFNFSLLLEILLLLLLPMDRSFNDGSRERGRLETGIVEVLSV